MDSQNYEAINELGQINLKQESYEEAIIWFRKLFEKGMGSFEIL